MLDNSIFNWTHYDQGTGKFPSIGDKVMGVHFENADKLIGVFAGHGDNRQQIGIVILDKPYTNGELATCIPVVCLRNIE